MLILRLEMGRQSRQAYVAIIPGFVENKQGFCFKYGIMLIRGQPG